MIVIRGSRVLTPQGLENVDLVIEGDRVTRVGSYPHLRGAEVIDGAGMITGPGLVDLHCHLRDPGETWKEDLESASRAARAGGFTAVVGMPNTVPAVDNIDLVRDIEHTCRDLLLEHTDPGEDSVGMGISITHLAPTPPGMHVEITATVKAVEGRKITLDISAKDDLEPIGSGTHTRFVVDVGKTHERLKAKAAKRAAAARVT